MDISKLHKPHETIESQKPGDHPMDPGVILNNTPGKIQIMIRVLVIVLIFVLALLWGEVIVSLSVWITQGGVSPTGETNVADGEVLGVIEGEEGGNVLTDALIDNTLRNLFFLTAGLTVIVAILIYILPLPYLPNSLI